MKRKKFTGYQQTLFNKYEIEETYIENRKQTDVLIELLEKIDKHENLDELTLLKRIKNAFRGSKVYKQIVCCVSIAAVMFVLQGHASMVNAEARFTPEPVTPAMLMQAEQNNKVVIDEESYLGEKSVQTNNSAPITSINFTVANSKAEIESNPQNSIVLDADSDVPVAKNQNMKVLNVIDSSIPDWQIIRDSISQGEVLIIDNEQTSLKEILEKAKAMGTIDTLNIISHGESGILRFGNKIISVENLEKESVYWNALGKQLSQNGDIQLFGCNIAEGEKGKNFIGKLAEITGADIAASINRTGNPELSGDWILEAVVGDIESQLPFIKEKIAQFKHLLPLPTGIQVIDTNNTTFDDTGNTATHKSGWFIVSGESDGAQKNTDISGTMISIYDNGPQTKFIVSADSNNIISFELEDISLANPYSLYTTLTLTDTSDSLVVLNGMSAGTLTKNGFAEWDTKVQDKSIKSFSLSWDSPGGYYENLELKQFTVDNMAAPVVQNPPTASDVNISGTTKVGEVLTGDYTYADAESDVEGVSTFKWYRADNNSGTGKTEIVGANAKTYTLQAADLGKYISFEVTPVAATGTITGTPVLSVYTTEIVATAKNDSTLITAKNEDLIVNQEKKTISSGTYTIVKGDSLHSDVIMRLNIANGAKIKLFRSDVNSLEEHISKPEEIPMLEIPVSSNFYISVEAENGVNWGKYKIIVQTPPTASGVNVSGTAKVGEVLTGGYTYADAEDDLEGVSTFKWYRATDNSGTGKTEIAGANAKTYTLQAADLGKYISFEVTPVAVTGIATGTAELSLYTSEIVAAEVTQTAPTASGVNVSGTTKVGEVLTGNYTYGDAESDVEGTSTFKWYRATDNSGTGKTEIAGANAKTYTLQAADLGKYISFEVTPVAATGTLMGTAELSSYTSAVVAASSGGSGGSGGGGGATTPTTPTAPKTSESGVIVIVNGEKQIAGTEYVTEQQGIKQVEVKVDTKVINQKIDAIINQPAVAGRENIVEVPILTSGANRILTSLNGDSIKKMDENDFKLSLVSQNISYTIPAKEINIDELAKTLNMNKSELQNLEIQISMDKVTDAVFKEIASNAEKSNYQLVLKPVEFTITAKKVSGDGSAKSVTISKFNQYVQREFEIPEGIDPTKITTGIVYNEDGTFSHIPTTVFVRDGKYYARLNSLTNSKYSVIWNPIEVKSVEKHWAKAPVNDMASRLIIKDIESFEPNKAITRGDFAEYITKAIGIYRTNSAKSKPFSDIELSNSLADAIAIASEYGIINGYPDGTFRPNETITREEAMSMYAKAMEITQLDNIDKARISKYKDKESVSKWAYSAVQSTIGSGVFNGRTVDKIEPKGIFTYAEAATAIRNLLVNTELINKGL